MIERSVGKPGMRMIAKNVPEKAMVWKIGIMIDGMNADGSRTMFTRLRRINPTDAGQIRVVEADRMVVVVVLSTVVIVPPGGCSECAEQASR